jgi:CTP synthase (UTP-ammonia lyase)
MTASPRIALVGDYSPSVKAHQAIPRALALAGQTGAPECLWEWLNTSTLDGDVVRRLEPFQGIWCVPGSPYANAGGALAAIRFARTTGRAFLGTCGGFQHALLEYAEATWGVAHPAHAEEDAGAMDPVISPLACTLVEQSGDIVITEGSRLARIYGTERATEGYHCSYGLNPTFADRLTAGPLRATARDLAGDVRAVELDGHPFFIATLFQPERSALANHPHPLIRAFAMAAAR